MKLQVFIALIGAVSSADTIPPGCYQNKDATEIIAEADCSCHETCEACGYFDDLNANSVNDN